MHRDQLLDALLPHVHFLNGQRIDAGEPVPVPSRATASAGPALGAGALGTTAVAEAFAPAPRTLEPLLTAVPGPRRVRVEDLPGPRGRVEAPPDPPPN